MMKLMTNMVLGGCDVIQRYELKTEYNKWACEDQVVAVPCIDGGWVKYEDLSSSADERTENGDLPGMWEEADLIGGATDCATLAATPAAPLALAPSRHQLEELGFNMLPNVSYGDFMAFAEAVLALVSAPLAQQSEPVNFATWWSTQPYGNHYDGTKAKTVMRDAFNAGRAGSAPASPVPMQQAIEICEGVLAERVNARFTGTTAIGIKACIDALRAAPAITGPDPEPDDPNVLQNWLDNAAYLLDTTPGAVRHRPGRGAENLLSSMIANYITLRNRKPTSPASTGPCSDDTAKDAEEFAYSTDEESYQGGAATREAAIDEAIHETDADVTTIWTGRITRFKPSGIADYVIEQLQEQAHDECDEWAENYLTAVTKEEEAELDRLILDWAARVETPSFFTVNDTQQHDISDRRAALSAAEQVGKA